MSNETLENPAENLESTIEEIGKNIVLSLKNGREAFSKKDMVEYRNCQQEFLKFLKIYKKVAGEPYIIKKKDYMKKE